MGAAARDRGRGPLRPGLELRLRRGRFAARRRGLLAGAAARGRRRGALFAPRHDRSDSRARPHLRAFSLRQADLRDVVLQHAFRVGSQRDAILPGTRPRAGGESRAVMRRWVVERRRLAVCFLVLPLAVSCAGSGSTTTAPPASGGVGATVSATGKLAKGAEGTCRVLHGDDGKDYSFVSSG